MSKKGEKLIALVGKSDCHFLKEKVRRESFLLQKNIEVDFYVPKEKLGIQVSYSVFDMATRERECNVMPC
ncbi:hypothetical protein [Proteiniphilum sp.]|uniref:hypothetical protein n=1 Tax=Proteiniphilum sp. TaxID=1926877 RepID=UPI00331B3BE1